MSEHFDRFVGTFREFCRRKQTLFTISYKLGKCLDILEWWDT